MLSKLDKRCANCEHRDTCNNKRMCGLEYLPQIDPKIEIKIDIDEDLQRELKKEIEKGFRSILSGR